MKIIIKEIDKYRSLTFKHKLISKYIIYLTSVNNNNIEAYIEYGEEAKKARVNELLVTHFIHNNNEINKDEIITELYLETTNTY